MRREYFLKKSPKRLVCTATMMTRALAGKHLPLPTITWDKCHKRVREMPIGRVLTKRPARPANRTSHSLCILSSYIYPESC